MRDVVTHVAYDAWLWYLIGRRGTHGRTKVSSVEMRDGMKTTGAQTEVMTRKEDETRTTGESKTEVQVTEVRSC
jgi:hypothetical protein